MHKQTFRRGLVALLAVVLLVYLDQWTKALAVSSLKGKGPFVLIENILELVYVQNTGAAFGFMKGMKWLFFIIAPAVSLLLFIAILRMPAERRFLPLQICFIFIMAGALGNLIDRVCLSYVVDFIYFKPIDWPVFNVADIYISVSAVVMLILCLFYYKEEDLDRLF